MTQAEANLKKTPLIEVHRNLKARLIEFGGWLMPVQYSGIIEEHKAVRTAAGLFDLSHMGEFEVSGKDALAFLQYVTTNDVSKLAEGQAQYTFMLYPDGGIVDDLIVYRLPDKYLLVVNASNIDKDFHWLQENQLIRGVDVILRNRSSATALISIQGPRSQEIVQKLTQTDLSGIAYYYCAQGEVDGIPALIARTGYTGEDGFELFVDSKQAEKLWNILMEAGKDKGLLPVGLGARDTLRLEAKMALYGNDIDGSHNPLEAGLGWAVKLDKDEFCGKRTLERIKKRGVQRKLVGFEVKDKAIARHGYPIVQDGKEAGLVTSGAPSPSVGKNIGLAYVPVDQSAVGTKLQVLIREKPYDIEVVKTPFYVRPDKQKKA
ncbi:MAG TPA: glycine cleavage system aminomethyltransferase GcvT [Chloroflexia bacterium]|nr:glycine cleavage system aminomethyltransferase GcvT [Chloroflexia bacterium]